MPEALCTIEKYSTYGQWRGSVKGGGDGGGGDGSGDGDGGGVCDGGVAAIAAHRVLQEQLRRRALHVVDDKNEGGDDRGEGELLRVPVVVLFQILHAIP